MIAKQKRFDLLSRSLHWERGLKPRQSHNYPTPARRSLHWERGLKLLAGSFRLHRRGRSLHWERGLKLMFGDNLLDVHRSLPSLGAWIETFASALSAFASAVAPFIGSVD